MADDVGGLAESSEVTAEFLQHFCDQQDLERVRDLEIELDAEEQHIESLGEHCPNLISLKLNGSKVFCVRELGVKFQNVKFLYLNRAGLRELDGIAALPQLEELYISFNEVRELSALQFHDTLQVLDLEANQVSELSELEALATCPDLTELTLEDNPVSKRKDYRRRVRESIPHLETLDSESLTAEDPTTGGEGDYINNNGSTGGAGGLSAIEDVGVAVGDSPATSSSPSRIAMADADEDSILEKGTSSTSTSGCREGSRDASSPPLGDYATTALAKYTSGSAGKSEASTTCENSVAENFSTEESVLEPTERDLIVEAVKATRQHFWKSRPGSSGSGGSRGRPASSWSRPHTSWSRPFTGSTEDRASSAFSSSSTSTNFFINNVGGAPPNQHNALEQQLAGGATSSSSTGDGTTTEGSFHQNLSLMLTSTSSSSKGFGRTSGEEDFTSDLTKGDDVLVGSNPLKAVRQRRRNLGMKEHHTGSESIHHLLAKFQSYMQPSCLGEQELERRKKAFEDSGARPKTADVRIIQRSWEEQGTRTSHQHGTSNTSAVDSTTDDASPSASSRYRSRPQTGGAFGSKETAASATTPLDSSSSMLTGSSSSSSAYAGGRRSTTDEARTSARTQPGDAGGTSSFIRHDHVVNKAIYSSATTTSHNFPRASTTSPGGQLIGGLLPPEKPLDPGPPLGPGAKASPRWTSQHSTRAQQIAPTSVSTRGEVLTLD
ncbi:unnamed protein product [Amoebophrya sp. A25]|nr:unnamed protein product [Amoebophrya sp. A25]|eukprot:GSA25T00023145001.1